MLHTETVREGRKAARKETRAGVVTPKAQVGSAIKRAPRVNIADELVASLNEAADIMAGKVAPSRFYPARAKVDVRAIRRQFDLSQPDFAQRFGFSLATLREWEQGRRQPEASARVLLLVIAAHPAAVEDVLARDVPVAAEA